MLKPVEKQRVAEEIVEQLRDLILTGRYPPGSKLPPERELAKRLGVNRASLREALKKLEHLGLVRIRQGDGTRVQNFMQTAGIELVSHLLPLAKSSDPSLIQDMMEFRLIFGRDVARLAAERASEADIAHMRTCASRINDDMAAEELFDVDFAFYLAMTSSTRNRVMGLLINTVRDAARSYKPLLECMTAPADVMRKHHAEMLSAISANDASHAAQLAEAYLAGSADRVKLMMENAENEVFVSADAEESEGEQSL